MDYESESEHSHKQQVAFLQKLYFAIFHKFYKFLIWHKDTQILSNTSKERKKKQSAIDFFDSSISILLM